MKLYEFLHHANELKRANNATAIFYVWFIDETKKATKSHICSTPVVAQLADNLLPCDIRFEVMNAVKANPFFGLEADEAFTEDDGNFVMVYIDGIAPRLLTLEEKYALKEKEREERKAKREAERKAKAEAKKAEREAKKAEKEAKKKADAEVKAKREAEAKKDGKKRPPKRAKKSPKKPMRKKPQI